jgi:hypothetical protein
VSEADLRLSAFPADLEADFCALPLGFVFSEIKIVVKNTLDDSLAGDEFRYLDSAAMDVFVMIRELAAKLIGAAFNFF